MGYYIKHIVTITEDPTSAKLERLQEIITDVMDYNFRIYPDHLDDHNWNTGMGVSHMDDCHWESVSSKMGEVPFTVHCVTEDGAIYDLDCYDGNVYTTTYRETREWYSNHEDVSTRAPGANPGYYDDPGEGEPYHIKYGGTEEIPAGRMWWIKDKDNDN